MTNWKDSQVLNLKGKDEKAYVVADMHFIKIREIAAGVTQVAHVKLFDPKGHLTNLNESMLKVGFWFSVRKSRI
jgi:hypothetical protein